MFVIWRGETVIILIFYVDIVLICISGKELWGLRPDLIKKFGSKDLGELEYFIGIVAARSKNGIVMSNIRYSGFAR